MLFGTVLVLAAITTALVSGLLLGFAIVAMPGIGTLDDRGFIRAFQVMDRVIQDRQPVFMLLWLGSVLSVIAAVAVGVGELDGAARVLLVVSAVGYLAGVQVPTATINIPLNDELQAVEVATLDDAGAAEARSRFEPRWNRWNGIRSAVGSLSALGFVVVLLWA